MDLDSLAEEVKQKLAYTRAEVIRKAAGKLSHDYLVPAGPYDEQWDWDAFFMGVALTAQNPQDGIYLRNWTLNFCEHAQPDGKVAGCLTPEGWDPRLHQMKPFLAQGAYIAGQCLNDFAWIIPHWDALKTICTYRERNLWNDEYDLAIWFDSMESGADNNVALLDYPDKSVIAADVNAFIYRDYLALSLVAEQLGKNQDAVAFAKRADGILNRMNKLLWCEEEGIYYNWFCDKKEFIRCVSYSSFVPLWAGMIDTEQGRRSIDAYLLNPDHMMSEFGLRTLSKQDAAYNNVNMIKPHSNWQGPVWPIASYLYCHALLRYGFQGAAQDIAQRTIRLVLKDLDQSGGMHENYDAETGAPLAAPGFVSWNILLINLLPELESGYDPFLLQ